MTPPQTTPFTMPLLPSFREAKYAEIKHPTAADTDANGVATKSGRSANTLITANPNIKIKVIKKPSATDIKYINAVSLRLLI